MAPIANELVALLAAAQAASEAEAQHYREVLEPLELAAAGAASDGAAADIDPAIYEQNNALCAQNCETEIAVTDFPVTSAADFKAKIAFMAERELFRGIDQSEMLQADADRLTSLSAPTSIQTLAKLRSDILDRQEAIDLGKKNLTPDGGDRTNAECEDRQCSDNLADLLNVMLTMNPASLADILSLAAAIAEISSQALVSDDRDVNDAGQRIQHAAEAMVAFLGQQVETQNKTDAYEVRRCTRIVGVRFPTAKEVAA
ncbi:hypothetical protein [Sphingomonas sp. T9W2]|uniref:hypothetical protein n=1 Tax=Sphingomonas sp. T9W2 TaxID=3143183 RepID=UPI0031F4F62A